MDPSIARRQRRDDASQQRAFKLYRGRVTARNPRTLTVDVGLELGGALQLVPVLGAVEGNAHGWVALPRIGDLVLVAFDWAATGQPIIVASCAEWIEPPQDEWQTVGGLPPTSCRLIPLFGLKDVEVGNSVARCPT